jgi:signal transduction histidine kinase
MSDDRKKEDESAGEIFANGGEAGELMGAIDWSSTPLGPVSTWSEALRMTVRLLLRNRFPLLLFWGADFVQLYNDAYLPILGAKHPRAMSRRGAECWSEIWHIVGPMIQAPFSGEPATGSDDLLVLIDRKGFLEECHFKFAYSPIPDATVSRTGVGGVLATVAETTEYVYVERQLRTLRELAARAAEASTPEQACTTAAATFEGNPADVPFALFYLLAADGKSASLVASSGFVSDDGVATRRTIDLDATSAQSAWPISRIASSGALEVVTDLQARFGDLPKGTWSAMPECVVGLPLSAPEQDIPYGVLLAGCSPHRALDDGYRGFFELAAAQVATAIRNARAHRDAELHRREAESANRAKDEFLAMLGHELRNPLSPMLTALQLMRLRGTASREQDILERQVGHLTRLVDDLLDVSRITRGKVELRRERIDVADAVTKAIELSSPLLEQRRQELEVRVPRGKFGVNVDPGRMEQVISNLLTNAAKYSEPGSKIVIAATREGDSVCICVKDEGVGIAPELLGSVFERFVQQPQTLARSKGGLGLGLAIVRSLVELHGGSVRAKSAGVGKGSEFVLDFPAVELSSTIADRAARPDPVVPPARRSKRILVVDDNTDAAETLKDALEALGYTVHAAHDGPTALQAAETFAPEVALLDIGLPVMDGYELARRLRELRGALGHLHLVAVTGYGQEADKQRSEAAGFERHLVKPVDLNKLEDVVEELSS